MEPSTLKWLALFSLLLLSCWKGNLRTVRLQPVIAIFWWTCWIVIAITWGLFGNVALIMLTCVRVSTFQCFHIRHICGQCRVWAWFLQTFKLRFLWFFNILVHGHSRHVCSGQVVLRISFKRVSKGTPLEIFWVLGLLRVFLMKFWSDSEQSLSCINCLYTGWNKKCTQHGGVTIVLNVRGLPNGHHHYIIIYFVIC